MVVGPVEFRGDGDLTQCDHLGLIWQVKGADQRLLCPLSTRLVNASKVLLLLRLWMLASVCRLGGHYFRADRRKLLQLVVSHSAAAIIEVSFVLRSAQQCFVHLQ